MNDAIGQILVFAVAASLSPIPIIGVVLMLAGPRAASTGPAFLVGWVVGLTLVGAVVLLVSGGADVGSGDASDGVSWVRVGIGVLMLVFAARQWRGRPRGDAEPEMPAWMKKTDAFGPVQAVGLGLLLSAVNPKNLLLTAGAALAIAQAGLSTADQAVALAVFVVVATIGPAAPVVVHAVARERAEQWLTDLKAWLMRSNAAVMTVILLLIGVKLIGDGIAG